MGGGAVVTIGTTQARRRITVCDPHETGEDHFVIDGPYDEETHGPHLASAGGVIFYKPGSMSHKVADDVIRAALRPWTVPTVDMEVKELRDLGGACPTQWEGRTLDGRAVYIRYRFGQLTVDVDGETLYSEGVGADEMDGVMTTEEMLGHTGITVVG